MATARETYQGYANYETWAVALWIDNDEGLYKTARRLAEIAQKDAPVHQNVLSGIWTESQAARFELADAIRELIEDACPDLDASLWSDLLLHALGRVEWSEVAEHFEEVS